MRHIEFWLLGSLWKQFLEDLNLIHSCPLVNNMSNIGNSKISPTSLHNVPHYDSNVEGIFIISIPLQSTNGKVCDCPISVQGDILYSSLWLCWWICTYGPIESKMFMVRCINQFVVVQNKPTWGICIHMKSQRCEWAVALFLNWL